MPIKHKHQMESMEEGRKIRILTKFQIKLKNLLTIIYNTQKHKHYLEFDGRKIIIVST